MFGLSKSAVLASLLFLSSISNASPVPQPEENPFHPEVIAAEEALNKRQGGSLPITGATQGGTQPRLEIRQMLYTKPNQWNIYLLALQQFQANPQNGLTSWFEIGGIHGAPAVPWDGVQRSSSGTGYCTHSSNLFPTWHRPYLALYEQKLQQAAIFVANEFTGAARTTYLNAAAQLRAPYWDWAAAPPNGNPALPNVVTAPTISVTTPQGQKTITNPLFRYGFHPLSNADFSPYGAPFTTWPFTLRYPTSTAPSASSQDSHAVQTIANNRIAQKQSLYNWFTLCPDYLQMSNDQSGSSSPSCHISLESLHNNIHVWTGGPNDGHMTVVPVSAFDPLFMLHHAMIDRLFAMWQRVYPNSYTPNQVSQINTFTIRQGSTQGPDSPLTPFHSNAGGAFWTSNEVRNWNVFHYTYPEFVDSDGSAASIRGYINRLYGPNGGATAGSSKMKRDEVEAAKRQATSAVPDLPIPTSVVLPSAIPTLIPKITASNGSYIQYIANIATTRFKLDGSYGVYVFMGDPVSNNAANWFCDANLVGSYGVFSQPNMTQSDIVTTSTVPLTEALNAFVADGLLADMTEANVVPFLQKKLQWRVAKLKTLEVIPPHQVPNFVLSVVASTQQPLASDTDFPQWSPFVTLAEITHGKSGGLQINQTLSYLCEDAVKFATNL